MWELRVSLGRDPATGKYRQLSKTFHGDVDGADEALRRLVEHEVPRRSAAASSLDARASTGGQDGTSGPSENPAPVARPEPGSGMTPTPTASVTGNGWGASRHIGAVLPLEVGEFVVGWSAERDPAPETQAEAAYGDARRTTYQLVQLHRVRRRSENGSSPEATALRSVWVPRELIELASPTTSEDSAIHVWTV